MSQRESGYARIERDAYETPEWVTNALVCNLDYQGAIWEPACGSGKMVNALRVDFTSVYGSDIATGYDFLKVPVLPLREFRAIITNPPYALAQEFIEHALKLLEPMGVVAMLLRTDFDHAKTRQHLFGECKQFAKKLVLTRRIVWFDGPKAAPSFNHAWYIWDWQHVGPPTLAYA